MSIIPAAFLSVAMSTVLPAGQAAWAQTVADQRPPDPICAKFQRTEHKWCALQRVRINGLNGSTEIGPGACFDREQAWFFGSNFAAVLNRRCPN